MEDRYLYRAKRKDNREWVEGYLVYDNFDHECRIVIELDYSTGTCFHTMMAPRVDQSTICQCTGLKDKNGKMIWENDICDRKEKYPEIVNYHDGDWTLDYSYASNNESGFNYCNLGFYVTERNCVEVIGNIFDNPELLEVGE